MTDRVICIAENGLWFAYYGGFPVATPPELTPVKNRIYTVRRREGNFHVFWEFPDDNYYQKRYFRPIVEKDTDIGIFTEILLGERRPLAVPSPRVRERAR